MKPLGLGEYGEVSVIREGNGWSAYLRYRDFSGRGHRLKRRGKTKAAASRAVLKAAKERLGADVEADLTPTSTFEDATKGWLLMFEGLVARGSRSPTTLDEYRYVVNRLLLPGLGHLRLGELTTPRLDRFVQGVLTDRGYASAKLSRSVLSGICSWLVRRGALRANPVREITPLEADRERIARALSVDELREWLALLDANEFAVRHDLPDLARFMLATGLRLGEALGVTWADVDLNSGTVEVVRTVVRVKGKGLVAKRTKSAASARGLMLPAWGVDLLRARRVRMAGFEGPVFPDSRGGWRDTSNVGKVFRQVRGGSSFEWVKTHTFRKTVATLLDEGGLSARAIADQLGHSRISMTQDVYLGRRAGNAANLPALEAWYPEQLPLFDGPGAGTE